MGLSNAMPQYADIRDILDRALEAPRGIVVTCATANEAIHWVSRLNYFRKKDREQSKAIYPADHPGHGRSLYDQLRYKRQKGDRTVTIIRVIDDLVEVREL